MTSASVARLLSTEASLDLPSLDGTIPESIAVDNGLSDDSSRLSGFESFEDKRKKIRRCMLTIFPIDDDPKWLDPYTYWKHADSVLNIWCGQFEICPDTQRLHAHIYLEFKNTKPVRFTTLTRLFRDILGTHINVKNPTKTNNTQRQGAVNYVTKINTRHPDHEPYYWSENNPKVAFDESFNKFKSRRSEKKESSKSEDIEDMRLWIESKPMHWTWDQIVHECDESKQLLATCSWGPKYHQGRFACTPRRTIKDVIILYGAGGTGKTTLAHNWDEKNGEEPASRYYRRNPDDGNFWGGGRTAYKSQRVVHFEEFCGQEPFHRIKEVCDIGKHGPSVNIKNSGTDLNHETVIISSNNHPAGWYRGLWEKELKQFHPFWRRVTKVLFFPPTKPDGSPNTPDAENPPYMIDQTSDWIKLQGDYSKCRAHASKYWPLAEEEHEVTYDIVHTKGFGVSDSRKNFFK